MRKIDHEKVSQDILPEELADQFAVSSDRFAKRLGKALSARVDRRYPTDDGGTLRITRPRRKKSIKKAVEWRVVKENPSGK